MNSERPSRSHEEWQAYVDEQLAHSSLGPGSLIELGSLRVLDRALLNLTHLQIYSSRKAHTFTNYIGRELHPSDKVKRALYIRTKSHAPITNLQLLILEPGSWQHPNTQSANPIDFILMGKQKLIYDLVDFSLVNRIDFENTVDTSPSTLRFFPPQALQLDPQGQLQQRILETSQTTLKWSEMLNIIKSDE